jgi:hypothetical protein
MHWVRFFWLVFILVTTLGTGVLIAVVVQWLRRKAHHQ